MGLSEASVPSETPPLGQKLFVEIPKLPNSSGVSSNSFCKCCLICLRETKEKEVCTGMEIKKGSLFPMKSIWLTTGQQKAK